MNTIKAKQITLSLRQLGFDKKLKTGLSDSEYRQVVNNLRTKKCDTTHVAVVAAVKEAVYQIEGGDAIDDKRMCARKIRMIKVALTYVAKELDVNVTLATSDYPVIIKLMDESPELNSAGRLAPLVAEYIFGGELDESM